MRSRFVPSSRPLPWWALVIALSLGILPPGCLFPAPYPPHEVHGRDSAEVPVEGDPDCVPIPWFHDVDGDGFGNAEDVVYACEAPPDRVADATDCDDSSPTAHPGLEEVCNDHRDNDCDGTDNGCALSGTLQLAQADRAWYGPAPRSWCGAAVAGGWDLGADELPEVVVGCDGEPGGGERGGAAHVLRGVAGGGEEPYGEALPASPITQGDLQHLWGAPDRAAFGGAVVLGDLGGDGYGDVVVGAAYDDAVVDAGGAAWLFSGPGDDGPRVDGARIQVSTTRAGLGRALALGDLDGDRVDELVVSAVSNSGFGTVWVLDGVEGRGTDVVTAARASFAGGCSDPSCARGDGFGMALAVADIDGDAQPDLVVGAPGSGRGGAGAGAVYAWLGPIVDGDRSEAEADMILDGAGASEEAGAALAVMDADDDGVAELVVGAPGHPEGDGSGVGAVHLVRGPVRADSGNLGAFPRLVGERGGDRFGASLAVGGDVNGDNEPDLLVGAPGHDPDAGGVGAGMTWLLWGPWSEGSLATAVRFHGPPGSHSAWSLAGVGDTNGDGYGDILVGAPSFRAGAAADAGAAFLIFGRGL